MVLLGVMMVVIARYVCDMLAARLFCWSSDTDRLDVSCAAKYDCTGRRHIEHLFDFWSFINKIERLQSLQLVRNLLMDLLSFILAVKQYFMILKVEICP